MPPISEKPPLLRRSQLPHVAQVDYANTEPGIYFLFDEAGQLVYVGKAIRVGVRCRQHSQNGRPFARATWRPVPAEFLTEYERAYVFEFSPTGNHNLRPKGPRPARKDKRTVHRYSNWAFSGGPSNKGYL